MKAVHRIAFFSLALLLGGCGGGGSDEDASAGSCSAFRVINGQECQNEDIPVVQIIGDNSIICTGTIISNDDVLTAAHCVLAFSSFAAEHDRGRQISTDAVANSLSYVSSAYDIAIIHFPNIASNFGVKPATLRGTRPTKIGDRLRVVGYGDDGSAELANGNPRATELIVDSLQDGLIITRFEGTESSPCHGDSGGAATFDGLIVASVVGGGREDGADTCAAGSLAAFTDLQNKDNADFIRLNAPGARFE